MAYLHENEEEFLNAVNLASERFHILPDVAEKDYYVTMILLELSKRFDYVVFKGGTSLSKCHKVINRFSEDIDITIGERITQGQMRKLKEAIKSIAEQLRLRIPNIDETHSRRSYNQYVLEYDPAVTGYDDTVQPSVLLETSYEEVSFPTVVLPVHSYIGEMMAEEAPEELTNYHLDTFDMKVQSIERTLVDKVFAICDYYMTDRVKKHSRHIYDIYKLLPIVPQTMEFKKLVQEVRSIRALNNNCPSAQPGVDIPQMLKIIIEDEVYHDDYEKITARILEETIEYETAIESVRTIAESGAFEE